MRLINAEGTLEIAPSIGYADIIADLVSTGITLRDNHLRQIGGSGVIVSPCTYIFEEEPERYKAMLKALK